MSLSHCTEAPAITNPREQRGQQIAAAGRIRQRNGLWLVPSQSGEGTYTVNVDGESLHCTCPDHEMRRVKCKHIYAVEYTIRCTTETAPDGTTTTTVTKTVRVRVTYRQNWPAYNAAQTHEGQHFSDLLHGLCAGIVTPRQQGPGRPRAALSDVVFSAVLKVYSTMSGRRVVSDLRDSQTKGHISKAPHYNCVFKYLENPALTPILKALVEESAAPLKAVESSFAVDSSGFSTSRFERWYDVKYGMERSERQWLKVHLMTGVSTNIVTSIEITDRNANDSPHLPALARTTAKRFALDDVSADKGYISSKNLEVIAGLGAAPYIPFKVNTTGEGPELWRRLYHYYQFNREAFLQHYHKRSNVETTFSMIKGKFGDALRSKTPTAQVNEALCKVLCHNICVLVASIYELGIEPTFWAQPLEAQAV